MNIIEEAQAKIAQLEDTIATIKQIIADYNVCESAISKKVLEAAVAKYVKQLDSTQQN